MQGFTKEITKEKQKEPDMPDMKKTSRKKKGNRVSLHICLTMCLTAALLLAAGAFAALPVLPEAMSGDTFSAFALSQAAVEQAAGDQAAAGEEKVMTRAPLTEKVFARTVPELLQKKCAGTSTGVLLQWGEVPGAEEYQVWRGKTRGGEYRKFAATKELELKENADGEYFYRIRAVRGKETTRWSMTVRLCCVSGYVEKVYYDKNGFTRFQIRVSNRTNRPVYFYGPGLYNANRNPQYQIIKSDLESGEKAAKPFPLNASLDCSVNKMICVPAGTENQKIQLFVPTKLPMLGESGMKDEIDEKKVAEVLSREEKTEPGSVGTAKNDYGNELKNLWFRYRVQLKFHPDMKAETYMLTITENEKGSKTAARVVR